MSEYKTQIEQATTKMELYGIAGHLNNHEVHVLIDKVTFMAFMDIPEAKNHCFKMLEQIENSKKGNK